ncbi:MAG: diadenylate cyclase [Kiritimatiellia bacterium]
MTGLLEYFSFSAVVQIAILYFAIYTILKGARGSRFGQMLMSVGLLAALLIAFSALFHFDVLSRIVQFLLAYIAVSTVVIFQPEIRRILSTVGAFGYLERAKYRPDGSATPELIVETLLELAKIRMGALIAFERGISLRSYEDTGVATDALFSRELVRSIFTPPMPLHDGGVIVRDGRLAAAHCIFPISNNPELAAHGMRHRAAVGLSEETDALVVVVSEESGAVSIAYNGKNFRFEDPGAAAPQIRRWIAKALPQDANDHGFLHYLQDMALKFLKGNGK